MKNFIVFLFLLNGTIFGRLDKDLHEKMKSAIQKSPSKAKVSRFVNIGQAL